MSTDDPRFSHWWNGPNTCAAIDCRSTPVSDPQWCNGDADWCADHVGWALAQVEVMCGQDLPSDED